jgi:hypothetical protein
MLLYTPFNVILHVRPANQPTIKVTALCQSMLDVCDLIKHHVPYLL